MGLKKNNNSNEKGFCYILLFGCTFLHFTNKRAEEIAEEKRISDELEAKRQEAIRVAKEAEERRRAEEAEKERLRLAEIARKQAEVQARWDSAHNKVRTFSF